MFVDASVLVAILAREADGPHWLDRLTAAPDLTVSPLVRYEATVALAGVKSRDAGSGRRPTPELLLGAQEAVDLLLDGLGATQIPITPEIGSLALDAAARFGKAVGHAADLNFGDCFAYACAKAEGGALLYKGEDFSKTDLA
ncbi:type II toxin-antitoxin system VapC family toxin [Methylobrevis pamukkalensis]|uniref:Ribonuclease VapC28 n=1 Tax=Methylobrevis pamukkalensis TaxID=1439726 RepID=A0A1E3H2I3_9HYPH|nr:type II toxin-antitoxin system VapC family toxin [Methylobrevis pamukkalensis]ODN70504.1 Ribonuclease VapC28 [Methylobrevis pamukkalensis]